MHLHPITPRYPKTLVWVLLALLFVLTPGLGWPGLGMFKPSTLKIEELAAFNQAQLCQAGDLPRPHAAHDLNQGHCLICFVDLFILGSSAVALRLPIPRLAMTCSTPFAVIPVKDVQLSDPRAPPIA